MAKLLWCVPRYIEAWHVFIDSGSHVSFISTLAVKARQSLF